MWRELPLRTAQANECVDITSRVVDAVAASGVREGLCVVYCPHTTAGITINENADPDVARDILHFLDRVVAPAAPAFRHAEGNAPSHVKASLIGPSVAVPVHGGVLALGRWQGILFCEFDGPRQRHVWVQVLSGS